jgi:hypothetical protein
MVRANTFQITDKINFSLDFCNCLSETTNRYEYPNEGSETWNKWNVTSIYASEMSMLTQFYDLLRPNNFITVSFEIFKEVNIMWSINRSMPDDEQCKAEGKGHVWSVWAMLCTILHPIFDRNDSIPGSSFFDPHLCISIELS